MIPDNKMSASSEDQSHLQRMADLRIGVGPQMNSTTTISFHICISFWIYNSRLFRYEATPHLVNNKQGPGITWKGLSGRLEFHKGLVFAYVLFT